VTFDTVLNTRPAISKDDESVWTEFTMVDDGIGTALPSALAGQSNAQATAILK
jgi:hypothetical protein